MFATLLKVVAVAGLAISGGLFLVSILSTDNRAPTQIAEDIAYARFGTQCPYPRTSWGHGQVEWCNPLFAKIERDYLAEHGGYR